MDVTGKNFMIDRLTVLIDLIVTAKLVGSAWFVLVLSCDTKLTQDQHKTE